MKVEGQSVSSEDYFRAIAVAPEREEYFRASAVAIDGEEYICARAVAPDSMLVLSCVSLCGWRLSPCVFLSILMSDWEEDSMQVLLHLRVEVLSCLKVRESTAVVVKVHHFCMTSFFISVNVF